jgi:hypothetical protein
MLKSLIKRLQNQGIATFFAEVQDPVLEFSAKTGLLDVVGGDHLFSTVDAAVSHIENNHSRSIAANRLDRAGDDARSADD